MNVINKIGVLTSGGDAPGMNAAIRAVVRSSIYNGCEAFGIYGGYDGLITGKIRRFYSTDVSNIIQRGGTILKTARSEEFRTEEGRAKAAASLKKFDIDGLVVIGGDGSFAGARLLSQEQGIPVIGIPGTIDNDIYGTDATIGYDTAVNTAIESIDKIKDTASAHNRLFFVEVMGRDAGFIALRTAIATGAEAVLVPEVEIDMEKLDKFISNEYNPKESGGIVVVAEGGEPGRTYKIAEEIGRLHPDYHIRVAVLGHMQRGGSPNQFDRVLASMMGSAAVQALLDDQKSIMLGLREKQIVQVPLNKTIKLEKSLNPELLDLITVLSTQRK